jgi:hypothetical protein
MPLDGVCDASWVWRVDRTNMGTFFVSELVPRIPSSEQPNRLGLRHSGSRVLYVGMMLWNEAGVIFSIQFNNNAVPKEDGLLWMMIESVSVEFIYLNYGKTTFCRAILSVTKTKSPVYP